MQKKKTKRRLLGLLAAAALCAGLLSGCGAKDPTAQELMDRAADAGGSGYSDMALDLSAEGDADGYAVAMTFTAGVEGSGDVSHVYDGKIGISMSGLSMEAGIEAWMDQGSKTAYVNMDMMGESSGWTKSSMDDGSAGSFGKLAGTDWLTSGTAEYVLEDHRKGDDWVVTFTVPVSELAGAMEEVAGTDADMDGDLDVEARFDEKTRDLKSITAACEADGMSIRLTVSVKSRSDKALSVPAEIVETAVNDAYGVDYGIDYDDGYNGYGYDDDDGYGSGAAAWIDDDGDGEDAFAAAFAQKVLDAGYADGAIYVWHYSEETEVSWDVEGSDWTIAAELTHITDDTYSDAMDEFLFDIDFIEKYMGDEAVLYKGGRSDGYAAYVKNAGYSYEMDYVLLLPDDGCVLTVDVYAYADSIDEEDVWDLLQSFLEAHDI